MQLWRLLQSFGPGALAVLGAFTAAFGLAAAAINRLLAAQALDGPSHDFDPTQLGLFLALLAIAKLSIFHLVSDLAARVQRANARLLSRLLRRIGETSLEVIDREGAEVLQGRLARCMGALAASVGPISRLIFPVGGIVGIAVVLALHHTVSMLLFTGGLAILLACWAASQRWLYHRYATALAMERQVSRGIGALLTGFKEIRLDPAKGAALQRQDIDPAIAAAGAQRGAAGSIMAANEVLGRAAPLVLMGIVGLIAPVVSPELARDGAIAAAIIIMLPTGLLASTGEIARANAAYAEAEQLDRDLVREPPIRPMAESAPAFRSLELRAITFRHAGEGGLPGFGIGPVNLRVRAGEIVFLVGGNGSGKSTLMKLLGGLYEPLSGVTLLNGAELDIRACRSLFSAIHADFHVFDRFYGHHDLDGARLDALLARFGLGNVTRHVQGQLTTTALSSGQRRRLAMVACLLDDKPILLLDEWAADQDPEFRRFFYRELLPELRAAGKTVIAASHDDRYFDAADRLIRLERGRITRKGAT
jgi:putative ATP-binding cassette transporter